MPLTLAEVNLQSQPQKADREINGSELDEGRLQENRVYTRADGRRSVGILSTVAPWRRN